MTDKLDYIAKKQYLANLSDLHFRFLFSDRALDAISHITHDRFLDSDDVRYLVNAVLYAHYRAVSKDEDWT